jgi:hypothetical protein
MEKQKMGFMPMDLEDDLRIVAKWGGTNIVGVIGFLSALIDSKITDNDLKIPPTKTGAQFEKAIDKKTKEIWHKSEQNYKGTLVGNMYYATISHLVEGQSRFNKNILKRYKPFRKYQK